MKISTILNLQASKVLLKHKSKKREEQLGEIPLYI